MNGEQNKDLGRPQVAEFTGIITYERGKGPLPFQTLCNETSMFGRF
jgi:hypothetical protein